MSDSAGGQKIGGTVGGVGGAAVGTYFGGPVGGAVGGIAGNFLGSAIGGGIGSLFGGSTANAQQAQALADEKAQRDRLTAIANGTGPSVAGLQLGQGLEQIQRQTGSEAAGTRGEGGVLARYGTMQAGANADAATNQAAAIARAQEIANANQQLTSLSGGTLGQLTSANTAANALQAQQQNLYLGTGLKAISDAGASKVSTAPPAPTSGGNSGGSLNFTAPSPDDEDGLATLAA
jgi:hypothetical protein